MAKVAIVTGGTRGIGAAIARGLKGAGCTVAATYRGNDEAAERFKDETGVAVYKWDVADADASAAGVRQVETDLGPVAVLVNNAGITRDGMFHRMTFDQWTAVMRTNLDSMFAMTRPVIEGMRERNFGRIVNISSINGQKGQIGQTNYSASKAGIIGFTKALAQENARKGVTVNCVCPGYIDTDMVAGMSEKVLESIVAQIPVGRLGKADEIASLVVYLASDDAAFMTGAVLTANGAQYMANG
jgi:acetoacetyl-CoA reductase